MSSEFWRERAQMIAAGEGFSRHLGTTLIEVEPDRVVVGMPYQEHLGIGRIHGGAISGLVDIAATAAFWAHPELTESARGATVGFTINFLSLAVATDLHAIASVRRRGGTLCTGDVSIRGADEVEIATAIVTYKLSR